MHISLEIINFISIYKNNRKNISSMTNSDTNRMEEDRFPIRSYGKGELAMLYIEGVKQPSAVKEFNAWIRKSPGLEQKLMETGMNRTARKYTPMQVQLIVNALGEP